MKHYTGNIKKILMMFMMLTLCMGAFAKQKTIIKKIKKTVVEPQKEYAESLIILSQAAADILYELGADDLITAIGPDVTIPEGFAEKPVIAAEDLNSQTILSYSPDYVFLMPGGDDEIEDALDELNIRYTDIYAASITELTDFITETGAIIRRDSEALALVTKIEEKLIEIDEAVTARTSFYYELSADPYIILGARSFINDLITKAGGTNIFEYINSSDGQVDESIIISKTPEVIFISSASGTTVEEVKAREGWSTIPAVQNNKIFVIDEEKYNQPTPACIDRVYELFELLK